MNPIVREFFRGLKERDELDVILPEMLTAMGFEVLSRPMVGTRQYGSDIAAVGDDTDGIRKLFLFSVKRGDLNRTEWNGASNQALRPSLDEIKDAYLNGVAPEHQLLPVVIVITIGGVILENTQPLVNGYMRTQQTPSIEYRVWSGDTLTSKVMNGALREEVFPAELRQLLRKASAMVEEPDIAIDYFNQLVRRVVADDKQEATSRARILYLALWILYVWGREANNLEAPYRASETVVLNGWELLWREIESDTSQRLEASHSFYELVQLHLYVWEALYAAKVLPHAASTHALSFAAGASETTDINLALFESAGRIAMGGLWKAWAAATSGDTPRVLVSPPPEVEAIALQLAEMPRANPAMYIPITDGQTIDLSLVFLFLSSIPSTRGFARDWVQQTSAGTMLAYKQHLRYPTIDSDYATLIRHPLAYTPEYRERATKGSILYPLLAMVAYGLRDVETIAELSAFQTECLAHCNLQTWVPNSRTESKIWLGDRYQGSSLGDLKLGNDGEALIGKFRAECTANVDFPALSAIRLGHWPVLLLACRHFRLPPPPQLWMPLLDDLSSVTEPVVTEFSRPNHSKATFRAFLLSSGTRQIR